MNISVATSFLHSGQGRHVAGARLCLGTPSSTFETPPEQVSLSKTTVTAEHLSLCLPGAYVPEGLLTSCSWDYMTFTPRVRAYTMLLFCFVFFLPLLIIIFCYIFIFRAIRETGR